MPKIEVNGATLDYTDDGAGDTLDLVPGGMADRRIWADPIESLSQSHRVIAYSLRHHWPNDPYPEGAESSFSQHVDDLAALISGLEIAPAHVMGHSSGGYLALLLAVRRPELVRSLVLLEPPAMPLFSSVPPKPHEIIRLLFTRPLTAIAMIRFVSSTIFPTRSALERGDHEAGMRAFLSGVLGRERFEAIPAEKLEIFRANVHPEDFRGPGFDPVTDDEVRGVKVPTLLVTGEHSAPIFFHITNRLEELMPNTQRVEIPDAAHGLYLDNPGAFDAAVASFLKSNAAG